MTNVVDIAVILVYLVGITVFGCSFYFRKDTKSARAFMAGTGRIPNWVVGLSLLATFISSISFLALPAKAYLTNWNPYVLSLTVPLAVVVAALVFVPFYRRVGCISAYTYLEGRFGPWARLYASGCFLLMQSARSGVILFLLALLVKNVLGAPIMVIVVVTAIATLVYSMMGGMTAVVWTDAIQAIVLIAGAVFCVVSLFGGLPGGFCAGVSDAWDAGKFSLGSLSLTDWKSETLWVTCLYGLFINLLTFGADQCYTQRYATAKDAKGAVKSMIGGYLLYVPVTFLFVVIGTGLWLFVKNNPGVVPPEVVAKSDAVFPWYIVHRLPCGVAGLLVAAVIAAAMSTIATTLNSGSTVILEDYYKRFFPARANERNNLFVLRAANVAITLVSIAVAYAVMNASSILTSWWAMQSLLSGGLLGLFLLGFFAARTKSSHAAVATALGTVAIAWVTFGQRLMPNSPWILHASLSLVVGTVVIVAVGVFLGWIGSRRKTCAKAVCAAIAAAACAVGANAGDIDEFACDPVEGQLHAPSLLPLANGGFLAVWYQGSREGAFDTAIVGARRIDGKWERPRVIAKVADDAHWNPVLRRGADGRIVLYFKVGHPIPAWKCYFAESRDEGATWSRPQELVPGDTSGGRGPVKNKCLVLPSGRVLAPGATEHRPWRPFIDVSDDDGRTWTKCEIPFPADAVDVYSIQPALWIAADGSVHALMRSNAGELYSSVSRDSGMTWSEAKAANLPNNNSGFDLVKASDGRLFLALNPVSCDWGGRNPLVVWESDDDGATWKYFRTIAWTDGVPDQWAGGEARHRDFSYPSIVECASNELALVHTYDRRQVHFVRFSTTRTKDLAMPLPEHPRPDWERGDWMNLNGRWDFRFDGEKEYTKKILVPFGWGSPLSGVEDKGDTAWYRRRVRVPEEWKGKRVFLVVGACDHDATVMFEGVNVGGHSGGYVPFECEITDGVKWGDEQTVEIRVWDEPAETARKSWRLYGKQGYGNARGIWQTVYLEARGGEYMESVRFLPSIAGKSVVVDVELGEPARGPLVCRIAIDGRTSELPFERGEMRKSIAVGIPSPRLWTLDDPHLYDATLTLSGGAGAADEVRTYFGFREIGTGKNPNGVPYVTLNGKPIYLMMALDQSYHPEGWYTFPSDEFMKNEILLSKRLGLNGNRVHIKVEVPRKLYWADRLGLLVQADVPCAWGPVDDRMFTEHRECLEATVKRDFNHPSVYQWTLFNETWGLHARTDAWDEGYRDRYKPSAQRRVAEAYFRTKAMDPTRLVEDNSACNLDHVVTDVNSWHAYRPWYLWENEILRYATNSAPGSAFNYIGGHANRGEPMLNSECGNVWGYDGSTGDCDWSWDYHFMMDAFRRHMECAGWLYTEHHDVINEWNGYVRFDRSPKFTGFGALFPGMETKDLHADVYLPIGQEPCAVVPAGKTLMLPVDISLATDRHAGKPFKLSFHLRYLDEDGELCVSEEREVKVGGVLRSWQTGRLADVAIPMPAKRAAGTANFSLRVDGEVVARNFTCFVTEKTPSPGRVTVSAGSPSKSEWSVKSWRVMDGLKMCGAGAGAFEYRFDVSAKPDGKKAVFVAEVSTKRLYAKDSDAKDKGAADLDCMLGGGFADRSKNANSYPMTSVDRWWGRVKVYANGRLLRTMPLPDDPADSRGILSWAAQKRDRRLCEAGSYGYLVKAEIPDDVLGAANGIVTVRLESDGRGLAVYGAKFGRYPLDPTIMFTDEGAGGDVFDPNEGLFPERKIVRRLKVDGRMVDAGTNGLVDLGAIYPGEAKKGEEGRRWATLSFEVDSSASRESAVWFRNDWFGELSVNGVRVEGDVNGPQRGWGRRGVFFKKGTNRVEYRTRAGTGGAWTCGLGYEEEER